MRETRVIQARRLTTILPAMTLVEAIAATPIHSMPGMVGSRCHVQPSGYGLARTQGCPIAEGQR
jgi:predicted ATPase with chaperone activity